MSARVVYPWRFDVTWVPGVMGGTWDAKLDVRFPRGTRRVLAIGCDRNADVTVNDRAPLPNVDFPVRDINAVPPLPLVFDVGDDRRVNIYAFNIASGAAGFLLFILEAEPT